MTCYRALLIHEVMCQANELLVLFHHPTLQVLCTERAWSSALTEYNVTENEDNGRDPGVSAYFAGSHKLKGIQVGVSYVESSFQRHSIAWTCASPGSHPSGPA